MPREKAAVASFLMLPDANHDPSLFAEGLSYFPIALHVSFQLRLPVLSALKAEVDSILADPESAVLAAFESVATKSSKWPHEVTLDELEAASGRSSGGINSVAFRTSQFGNDAPSALSGAVQVAAGAVAVPFFEAGIHPMGANRASGGAILGFKFDWTTPMLSASRAYSDLAGGMAESVARLRQARRDA